MIKWHKIKQLSHVPGIWPITWQNFGLFRTVKNQRTWNLLAILLWTENGIEIGTVATLIASESVTARSSKQRQLGRGSERMLVSGIQWSLVVASVKFQSFRLQKVTGFLLLSSSHLKLTNNRRWSRSLSVCRSLWEVQSVSFKSCSREGQQPKQRRRSWHFTLLTPPISTHDFVRPLLLARGRAVFRK